MAAVDGGSLFRVPGTPIPYGDDTYDLVISRKSLEGATAPLSAMCRCLAAKREVQLTGSLWRNPYGK